MKNQNKNELNAGDVVSMEGIREANGEWRMNERKSPLRLFAVSVAVQCVGMCVFVAMVT